MRRTFCRRKEAFLPSLSHCPYIPVAGVHTGFSVWGGGGETRKFEDDVNSIVKEGVHYGCSEIHSGAFWRYM